VKITEEAGSLE